jgi:cbb3-type cytochrome oxidase subunit 3
MIERLSHHLLLLQYAHVLWGFALFCALALWAYWPSRKGEMQRRAALILRDDDTPSERGRHEH